ncbi:MAG: glycine cleavage system aminomethyltransferase GcvT [Bacteroidetes bacterium]|nr:MAG: glycine cleavage system aminomethyltransferase GcvT [Bacteroidota bacterium]
MKKLILDQVHQDLGGKMVDFAGYNMPVQYEGLNAEHLHVRSAVGVFDVSHMGEFFVEGPQALDFLQKVSSNDVSKLTPGKIQYSCLPNDKGGIVDDLLIYCLAENSYLLVVNASNIEKDYNWLASHLPEGLNIDNQSDNWSLFALQGPKAAEALQSLTDLDLAGMKYYTFDKGAFAGCDNVIVSATGYTGAGGFEIYVPNEHALQVWEAIFKAGADWDIKPIGLGARDTLRLEMGFCLYGNDIDDTTSPLEAGLGWITKFTKDFINSEALKAEKEAGLSRRLTGFIMEDRGIPRHDYAVLNADGENIGVVTSGTQAPSLGKAIGMAYLQKDYLAEGTEIFIQVRNKALKAKVSKPPFYKG